MDDVIIVGKLDASELTSSIDKLVAEVSNKSQKMATDFTMAMDKMKLAMKDFAITQKVGVDLMQEAWRKMSQSFDAMIAAQSSSGRGGSGGGGSSAQSNTIKELRERIKEQAEVVNQQQRGTVALQEQVNIHGKLKQSLKEELQTTEQITRARIKEDLRNIKTSPNNNIAQLEKQMQALERVRERMRNAGFFKTSEIQSVSKEIDKIRTKIESLRSKQPKSMKDVLGMDENSVDAIAKKMQALKRVQIDPNNAAQVKQLGNEYQRLSRLQSELLGKSIQQTKSNNYLAQSFGYIRNRIVYALTLGAITNFTKQVYEIRAQYELLERSLGVLVNSFERGSQVFQQLNQMALESPFTLLELAGAAKQLTAYNFEAKEVVDTTRRLADISAALGVPMERLVYNLGQIRAQTVLTARDARDFANAGLPIVSALAERFTELEGRVVTTGDVYDRMKKKMVSYNDVMSVLNQMTDEGGKFFNFQAKQAETLRVQLANLNLAWNNMLNAMGKANQGLLTLPISGLKSLLQNWESINRVLKSIIISFGIWKGLQVVAIRNQWQIAYATGATAKQMGFFVNSIKSLGRELKAIAVNPWTWIFTGIMAFVDLTRQVLAAREAIHELNQEIRDNAKEASDSMLNFLNNKGNRETLALAKQNALTSEQGEKAWEAIQKQIEQSAMSSNNLIAELLKIEDINERVRVGFDYAERIQKAQAALQDLKDNAINVTSSTGWFGMFGEGLVDDLKDYARALERVNAEFTLWDRLQFETRGTREGDVNRSLGELRKEISVTAESISNFINAYNITDPLQINEIYERVRSQIKARNPEIKGELAKIFDIELDQKMAQLTNNAIDSNTSLWSIFMERLRTQSSAAFQDITDDWVNDKQKTLSKEQQEAVDRNLQYFKDSMPYAYDAVAKMVADASQLKINIGITFNSKQLSDFQSEVNKRINNATAGLDFGSNAFMPTNQDDLLSWTKARQSSIKALKAENKAYERDDTEWAKQKIESNNRQIQQQENLLDLFHQQHEEEKKSNKKTGGRGIRKQEDIVAEALKQELSLIKEMQSNYDKLRKSGVSNMDAIDLATRGYEATIERVNKVLAKYGIDKFNASNFAGKDVRGLLDALTQQRDTLLASGKVKTSSLKDLEVEIQKLTIDAKTYDMKKITDGLNNELGKLKDEYELAVELDANPELGNMFADFMGVNLDELPKTFQEVSQKAQEYIDKVFKDNDQADKIDVASILDKESFDAWIKDSGLGMESELVKTVDKFRQYLHKVQVDETKQQFQEWDKLLEKYAEYEYRKQQLRKEYESDMEKARKQGAGKDITNAITTRYERESARMDFEEYQRTADWIVATGDLSGMTDKAIGGLIKSLEEYKKKAKNLDPKQIKQINNALKNLYKQQRSGNPFKAIANAMQEAKSRASEYDEAIEKTEQEVIRLNAAQDNGIELTKEQKENLQELEEELKRLRQQQEEAGEVDASTIVGGINDAIAVARQATSAFADMANAIGGKGMTDAAKTIQDVVGIVEKAGAGAAAGAQIGGGYGAIIGAVVGGLTGVITTYADKWSGNAAITDSVEDSVRSVKRLENAYKELEDAIDHAYGTAIFGAQRTAIANKELQLAELKRQLQLEYSRKSKNRDKDKIEDLKSQIIDLELEIKNATEEVINGLLGISSVGDAMESLMDGFVEALRGGENAMESFDESIDEMIANMVKKMFTTKILQPWFEEQWNVIQSELTKRAAEIPDELAKIQSSITNASLVDINDENSLVDALRALGLSDEEIYKIQNFNEQGKLTGEGRVERLLATYEKVFSEAQDKQEQLTKELANVTTPTTDDIRRYAELLRSGQPIMEENMQEVADFLRELGLMKDSSSKELSALQQGIQGITEDTAGAIEAYMNILSQRVFEHGTILTEIRDIIATFDLDVQLGVQSQMLLQLQNSYQVQMSIQSILQGWSNANGMAVRVELN